MEQLILFLRLAVRNVWRSPRRSLLTMAAIAFGLFCLIVFQGLKAGLHREMVASTVQLDAASLQVVAAGRGESLTRLQPLRDPQRVVTLLNGRPEAAASLRLRAPGLLSAPAGSAAVVLTGVDPAAEARVTLVAGRLSAGRYLEPRGGVLLGAVLAESLGVTVGDEVTVLVQTLFGKPGSRRLPVRGIYRTALASFDRSHVFLDLPTAQALFDAAEVATAVAVRVAPEHEAELAGWLRGQLPRRALPGGAVAGTGPRRHPVDRTQRRHHAPAGADRLCHRRPRHRQYHGDERHGADHRVRRARRRSAPVRPRWSCWWSARRWPLAR